MGTKSRIVTGRTGKPLAGKVSSFYLDTLAVAHVKTINSGKTVVLFLRGWQAPLHVHCAEVVAVVGERPGSEAELVCKIVRIMQSNQGMYLRVCDYAAGRIVQVVDYNPQFCEDTGQSFCVAVARKRSGDETGRGELLYQRDSVTIWRFGDK